MRSALLNVDSLVVVVSLKRETSSSAGEKPGASLSLLYSILPPTPLPPTSSSSSLTPTFPAAVAQTGTCCSRSKSLSTLFLLLLLLLLAIQSPELFSFQQLSCSTLPSPPSRHQLRGLERTEQIQRAHITNRHATKMSHSWKCKWYADSTRLDSTRLALLNSN